MHRIKDYYLQSDVSQSSLKDLLFHPRYYKAKHIDKTVISQKTEPFLIGSATDCLLLTPEFFDEMFFVLDIPLSPQVQKLLELAVENKVHHADEEFLFSFAKEKGLFGNITKFDTFKKNLIQENFKEAIEAIEQNSEKEIISKEIYFKSAKIANSFLNNSYTRKYFQFSPEDNIEFLTAFPVYFIYKNVRCKALIDFLHINHNSKSIMINDLKTTFQQSSKFVEEIFKHKYYIQGAFYVEAINYWKKYIKPEYKDYTIEGFRFFVDSTTSPGSPLIYSLNHNDLEFGKFGGTSGLSHGYKKIYGFDELFEDLKWHKENDLWDYTRNQYENKLIMPLNFEN